MMPRRVDTRADAALYARQAIPVGWKAVLIALANSARQLTQLNSSRFASTKTAAWKMSLLSRSRRLDMTEEKVWRKWLLHAVCNGDSAKLEASIALLCDRLADRGAASADVQRAILVCLNQVCPFSGMALLHYAVLGQQAACVRVLLRRGADCNVPFHPLGMSAEHQLDNRRQLFKPTCLQRLEVPSAWLEVTPLMMAMALSSYDIIGMLASEGATFPVHAPFQTNFACVILACDDTMVKILTADKKGIVPLQHAIAIVDNGAPEYVRDFLAKPGVLRWAHASSVRDIHFTARCLSHKWTRSLLSLPCATTEDIAFRRLSVQYWLVLMCANPGFIAIRESSVEGIVRCLLHQGASVHGWDITRFKIVFQAVLNLCHHTVPSGQRLCISSVNFLMEPATFICNICETNVASRSTAPEVEVDMQEGLAYRYGEIWPCSRWSMIQLLPVVVRYCSTDGNEDDGALQALLAATTVPWLKSLSQIPWKDGKLHDGPTCRHAELSAEQRKVTLGMCARWGGRVSSLRCQARQALMRLAEAGQGAQFVEQLPSISWPLKMYLLS